MVYFSGFQNSRRERRLNKNEEASPGLGPTHARPDRPQPACVADRARLGPLGVCAWAVSSRLDAGSSGAGSTASARKPRAALHEETPIDFQPAPGRLPHATCRRTNSALTPSEPDRTHASLAQVVAQFPQEYLAGRGGQE